MHHYESLIEAIVLDNIYTRTTIAKQGQEKKVSYGKHIQQCNRGYIGNLERRVHNNAYGATIY